MTDEKCKCGDDIAALIDDLAKAKLFCPKCGSPLKLIDGGPQNMCGAILTHQCQNKECGKKWEEDQSGIVARPTNLTEVIEGPIMDSSLF